MTEPVYLHNLIIVHPRSTRASSVVLLAWSHISSLLQSTNHFFRHMSPCCFWNQRSSSFCQPVPSHLSASFHLAHVRSFLVNWPSFHPSLPNSHFGLTHASTNPHLRMLVSLKNWFHRLQLAPRILCQSVFICNFFCRLLSVVVSCGRLCWLLVYILSIHCFQEASQH